jgi:hypothetical protein
MRKCDLYVDMLGTRVGVSGRPTAGVVPAFIKLTGSTRLENSLKTYFTVPPCISIHYV